MNARYLLLLMPRLAKTILFVLIITCTITGVLLVLFPLPPLKPWSLVILDRNGAFLHAFRAADGIWRIRTSPDEIPAAVKRILIEKEDRFFYYHPGINPFALVRAAVQNITTGRRISGASTITMQIARMLEPSERTYTAKIVEMFRAVQLEMHYSKEELLGIYLSMVPLGGNVEGLKSAALLYYQTPPERLNIAQLFDLILIPNDPNDLRPDRHPDRLFAQRIALAARWVQPGLFSRTDSVALWQTPASAHRMPLPRLAPHFSLRIRRLHPHDATVVSSLDLHMQESVERLVSHHMRTWKPIGVHNAAVLVVRNSTREVLAYAGSEDFADDGASGQVDAIRALRSPGSTLKPLLFAMAMDEGVLTPKTRLLDTPFDGDGFIAENYDGTYAGSVTAEEALQRSLNVPMIRLLQSAGVPAFVDFVRASGITSVKQQESHLGLSLILGGCGVTLEELTTAYASFPGRGTYAPLRYLRTNAGTTGTSVFSPSAAFMVTTILAGLNRPDLPNNFESSVNLPTVAFKTGTSYGRRDAWAIGYSAEYTVGVWVGNVTNEGNPDLVGSKSAAPLLINIFNAISGSHQKWIMPQPDDVREREVCTKSGLAPTSLCHHRILDYYSVAHTLPRQCDVEHEYMVSRDGTVAYCPSCVAQHSVSLVAYDDEPRELLSYWDRTGVAYRSPPPHNPACTRLSAGDGPTIISPGEEMTYYFTSPGQLMALMASSALDVHEHVWYVDNRMLVRRKSGEKVFITFSAGPHVVSCLDDKGRMSSVTITVKIAG